MRSQANHPAVAAVAGGQAAKDDRQFVAALARGLGVLRCFSAARPTLGVSEIAASLGLPQPTVWRLCHTLTEFGYLAVAADGRLRPALAVLRLGYPVFCDLTPGELARPNLQQLATHYGAAAGLAVPDGADMRFVERCEGDSQLLLSLRVGSRVPIATSALGWAYLAALPESARSAAVGQSAKDQAAWRAARPAFQRALPSFKANGFIINPGVLHPGYHTAAVAVAGRSGQPAFAVNCGGAASVLSSAVLRDEIGPALRQLATLLEAVT